MSLRYAVLGLVTEMDGASGYDLQKVFELSLNHVWHATQSQVYGELGKLEADGLVEVVGEGARGRKAYAATPAGRTELRRWLAETEPRRTLRLEPQLRVFFLGHLSREGALDYLADMRAAAREDRAALDAVEEVVQWNGDDMLFFGQLVLEHGRRLYATTEEWCDWAEQRLRDR